MSKLTSLLLGILSAIVSFIMIVVALLCIAFILIPLHILEDNIASMLIWSVFAFSKMIAVFIIVMLFIPIVIYVIATPQYFLYLDDDHFRFILKLHKYFNLLVGIYFFYQFVIDIRGILFEGELNPFWIGFHGLLLCITGLIGLLTNTKQKKQIHLQANS